MVAACLVAAAACGPGLKQPAVGRALAHDALLDASGDPAKLERLFRGSVVNGGILFSDAGCQQTFGTMASIPADKFHAFAVCLAALHLREGERTDAYPDVTIVTYAPGIELEARVLDEKDGPRLSWIGFAGRADDADTLPAMSPSMFESLRTAGTPTPSLTGSAHPAVWVKLCLDANGDISSVTPIEMTSPAVLDQAGPVMAAWRFKPPPIGPACSTIVVGNPRNERLPVPNKPGEPPRISPDASTRISGVPNVVPDDATKVALRDLRMDRVVGSFKLTIDADGKVLDVAVLRTTRSLRYDTKIIRTIKETWRYKPMVVENRKVPFTTAVTFIYSQL